MDQRTIQDSFSFPPSKNLIHALIDVIGVEREEKERFNFRQISGEFHLGRKRRVIFPLNNYQFSLQK